MKKILACLLLTLACSIRADDNIAVLPGMQYVLQNVATGSYLTKDGSTTTIERNKMYTLPTIDIEN